MANLLEALSPVVKLGVRPNWETFGRPGSFASVGIIIHHTAGRNDLNVVIHGRPDLPGPLANLYSDREPPYTITLISGRRCNHAGPGAQKVLDEVRRGIAPTADAAKRGLADGPSGNAYFYGIEAENLGDGVQPWPPEQLEAIAKTCAAICKMHGWTANRVIGHREWTRRKPDPRGFSMASMRTRVGILLKPIPVMEDEDMAFIVTRTDNRSFVTDGVWKRPILGPTHFDELVASKLLKTLKLSDDHIDAIPNAQS